jgi:hypothetical protein
VKTTALCKILAFQELFPKKYAIGWLRKVIVMADTPPPPRKSYAKNDTVLFRQLFIIAVYSLNKSGHLTWDLKVLFALGRRWSSVK